MSRQRQRDTRPEIIVRRALTAIGLHYRLNNRDLPGSPDIANRSRKWVVFVHGCYWHRHDGCPRATTPKRNRSFWLEKFQNNQERDRRVCEELEALGYRVATIWECQTRVLDKLERGLLKALSPP
jgi:DNA mismatch endonuclease (patch repair protein)